MNPLLRNVPPAVNKITKEKVVKVAHIELPKNLLLKEMTKDRYKTKTENGADAYSTTFSANLDLFASGGAMRSKTTIEKENIFAKALKEEPLTALKNIFYLRDIREGKGEREAFKVALKYMAVRYSELVWKNIGLVKEYGRWDDLFVLFGTPLETVMMNTIKDQLLLDVEAEKPSLLNKWLPSINTSSKVKVAMAYKFANFFGITPRQYRKMLVDLRNKINIVETTMSKNNWKQIDYSKVPSKASLLYRKAFYKHDEIGFNKFIEAVKSGEKKINVKDLFASDIVNKALQSDGSDAEILDVMWKSLPDFTNGKSAICMIDTSGSMFDADVAHVAFALGIYFAERSSGPFKDHYITFSSDAKLVKLEGENIAQKASFLRMMQINAANTNVISGFKAILDAAISANLEQKDLPESVIIISDMEFDIASSGNKTPMKQIKTMFDLAGYVAPKLIFWNVCARGKQFPATFDEKNVNLVSGYSTNIFKSICSLDVVPEETPLEAMLRTLNVERYEAIKV